MKLTDVHLEEITSILSCETCTECDYLFVGEYCHTRAILDDEMWPIERMEIKSGFLLPQSNLKGNLIGALFATFQLMAVCIGVEQQYRSLAFLGVLSVIRSLSSLYFEGGRP